MASVGANGWAALSKLTNRKPSHTSTRKLGEAPFRLGEVGGALHRRRTEQAAVEAVHPLVIGAGEGAAVAAIVDDLHAAVLADRREGVDVAVLGTGDDQPFVVDGRGEVIAGIGDLVDTADAEPFVIEERSPFEIEELVGGVARGAAACRP